MKKQMHRLLSLMLSLILVVGMIPGTITAHAEETTVISSVNLTGFTVPSAGDNATAAKPAATTESGKGYTFKYGTWLKSDGSNQFTGTFEAGETYIALLALRAEEGYEFAPTASFSATVKDANGNTITVKSVSVGNSSRANDVADVRVEFTIPAEGGETPEPTISATVKDVTVNGTVGVSVPVCEFVIYLNGDTFVMNSIPQDITSWFINMPSGMTATKVYSSGVRVDVRISGTPTVASSEVMQIAIPADVLTSSESALTVDANANAKFNIVNGETPPTKITDVNATVAEPVVGGTPSTVATTTGTDYTVFVRGWYDENENTVSVFEAGKTYTLEVGFTPKEGYVLAGSKTLNATINDKEAEYLSLNTINGTVTCFIRYTIPAVVPTEYDITVTGGTASANKAVAGTEITLTVNESAIPAGKVFDKWEVVSGGVTVADGKFTMPERAVEINATYKDAPAVQPTVIDSITIEGLPAPQYGQTPKEYIDNVGTKEKNGTLKVNNESFGGHAFGNLKIESEGLYDSTKTNIPYASSETITEGIYYYMFELYTETGFIFADIADISASVNGNASVEVEASTVYEDTVNVWVKYEVTAPAVQPFVDWIEIGDVTAPVAGTDASIAPNYVVDSARNYTVEKAEWWMNDSDSKATEFLAGTNYRAVFTVVPKEGVVFDSPLKVKINGNDATVISSSEDKAVVSISLTATGAPVVPTEYDITVNGGTASANKAVAGTVITLSVDESAIPAGKVFDKWEVVSGGVTVTDGKFTMPESAVEITATYKDAPVSHTCDIKPVAKDEPSCTEDGKEAYYKCEGCGKFYEDALGAKEITDLANWGNLPKLGHTESDWKSDKDNHWKECTVTACGVTLSDSKAAHKDDNKDGKCDVCEYNVGLPTTPDDDKPNDNPQTGDNSNEVDQNSSLWWLWVLIAIVVVGGGIAIFVFVKKKKQQ